MIRENEESCRKPLGLHVAISALNLIYLHPSGRLFKEGLSQQEVDKLVQKERRKEERVLKNERKLVCLNCRQPGHMVSACPNIEQADGEGQPSICYTVRRCTPSLSFVTIVVLTTVIVSIARLLVQRLYFFLEFVILSCFAI